MDQWYTIPVKVLRNGAEIIVPANEVQKGDYVFCCGIRRLCDGGIPDDDDEVYYLRFGIDLWPAEMFDSK